MYKKLLLDADRFSGSSEINTKNTMSHLFFNEESDYSEENT